MLSVIKSFFSEEIQPPRSIELSQLQTVVKTDLSFFRNKRFLDFASNYYKTHFSSPRPTTGVGGAVKLDSKYNRLLIDAGIATACLSNEPEFERYFYTVELAIICPSNECDDGAEVVDPTFDDECDDDDDSSDLGRVSRGTSVDYELLTFELEQFGGMITAFIEQYSNEPQLGLADDFNSFDLFLFTHNQSIIESNFETSVSYFNWMTFSARHENNSKMYSKLYDHHFDVSRGLDREVCITSLQNIINYCKITNTPPYFSQLYNVLSH
jgi:hypothetical protein